MSVVLHISACDCKRRKKPRNPRKKIGKGDAHLLPASAALWQLVALWCVEIPYRFAVAGAYLE